MWKTRLLQTLTEDELFSIYENPGSQFFRTTIIQSGLYSFDESGFVITFLTIFGVKKVLCSFRVFLEGNTSTDTRVIKFSGVREVFSQQFALSDAEDKILGLLNKGGTLLAICQKSQERSFWEATLLFY